MNDYIKLLLMLIISFLLCFIFCKIHLLKFNSQPKDQIEVKQLNPLHKFKSCGGVDFILSTLITFILFNLNNINKTFYILVFTSIYFSLIGFMDDFIKIKYKDNKGLSPLTRIILEIIGVIVIIMMFSIHLVEFVKIKNINLYLGSFSVVYALILILGCCNGLNLTDGLDGLATITYILSICPFVYIAIKQQNDIIVYFLISLIGSLLAFLIFNFNHFRIKIFSFYKIITPFFNHFLNFIKRKNH